MIKRLISFLLAASLCLSAMLFCASCTPEKRTREFMGGYFDTHSVITVYRRIDDVAFEELCAFVEQELEKYDRLFDIYFEYAGVNNIRTVNKNAGKQPVAVSRELFDFLTWCKEIFTLTQGATNVAMGGVLKKWHNFRDSAPEFGMEAEDPLPTEEELSSAAEHIDITSLVLDGDALTAYISDPACSLDVGAVGKGYAAERIAEGIRTMGYESVVINVGGNIRAVGNKPSGGGWSLGITHPDRSRSEFVTTVTVSNTAVVTSGNYERYVTKDGASYHHLIDPATLLPADHYSSVTVILPDSGLADALSTAIFCLPPDEGKALFDSVLESYPTATAILVENGGDWTVTTLSAE